jgi:hypothetical protein
LVELQDFDDKDPLHWIHVAVFCLAIMAAIFMMKSMRPTLVRLEDPNSVELQVVERKK